MESFGGIQEKGRCGTGSHSLVEWGDGLMAELNDVNHLSNINDFMILHFCKMFLSGQR